MPSTIPPPIDEDPSYILLDYVVIPTIPDDVTWYDLLTSLSDPIDMRAFDMFLGYLSIY